MNRERGNLLCAILFIFAVTPRLLSASEPLHLRVVPSCASDRTCTLNLTLSNVSGRPITLYESFLPWRLNGMVLLVTENRPLGKIVNGFAAIDDPTGETITLEPGRSASGSINLLSRFPDIISARRNADLLVFGSYEPKGLHVPVGTRLDGSTLINRMGQQTQ